MKTFRIGIMAVLVAVLASCTVVQKSTPLAPVNIQVLVNMDDLEYVGDVTGTTTQSYVFGVIPVGGRRFHVGTIAPQGGISLPSVGQRGVNNALYDALQQKPDADFLMPVSVETKRHVMFLGNKTVYTVRAKAFRIKNK